MGKIMFLAAAGALLCSCAPRPSVMTDVENRAGVSLPAATKLCLVGDPASDPQVRERIRVLVRDGLSKNKFEIVSCADAQYAVLFDWRLSGPREARIAAPVRSPEDRIAGFVPYDYKYSTAALALALYDARRPEKSDVRDALWHCGAIMPSGENGGFAEWDELVSACAGRMAAVR